MDNLNLEEVAAPIGERAASEVYSVTKEEITDRLSPEQRQQLEAKAARIEKELESSLGDLAQGRHLAE